MSIHYSDNIETRYFKGYINNFFTVGSPTFEGSVVSGFSSANYLRLPFQKAFNPESNPWEVVLKIKLTTEVTTQGIFGYRDSGYFRLDMYQNKLRMNLSTSSSSWNIGQLVGNTEIPLNVYCWIKYEFTGEAYNLYYSWDGINYQLDGTLSSTSIPTFPSTTSIGAVHTGSNTSFLNGSLDLSECYININGQRWWDGLKRCKYDYNFNVVGTPTISNPPSCMVSGFSKSAGLTMNESFAPVTGDTWEMNFKVHTGSNVSTKQQILGGVNAGDDGIEFGIYSSKLVCWLGTSSYNLASEKKGTYTVLADTDYWIRVTFDGENYTFYYSLDGDEYIQDIQVVSTSVIKGGVKSIGFDKYSGSNPFLGSIDLTQSYIKINNQLWWTCFKQSDDYVIIEESTKEDYDFSVFEDGKIAHLHRGDLYRIDYYKGYINNFFTIGSLTFNGKVVSGFSDSNYLRINEAFAPKPTDTWEKVIKYTTTSDVTSSQAIIGDSIDKQGMVLVITTSKLATYISSGSSWDIALQVWGTYTLLPNTTYWFKVEFTGVAYNIYYSLNGVDYILDITIANTKQIGSSIIYLGRTAASSQYVRGSIDLSESYIKVNNEFWWYPYKRCKYDYNFTTIGTPSISNKEGTCEVSGFSASNCLTIDLPSSITSSEYFFKIKTGDSVTSPTNQVISSHKSPNTWIPAIKGGKICVYNGSWQTGITSVTPNTTYYIKSVFNGSSWVLYSSTDNESWTTESTWTTTTNYAGTTLYIGRDYDTTGEYFGGSIDLTQSYIKINGELWWSCFKTSTDYVFTENSDIEDYDYSKPYKGEIVLGYKGGTLVYSIYPNGIVFEENTAGTYTINPAISGAYEISLVGPGSGGTCAGDQASYASKSRGAGGGSGAYVKGIWNLTRGVDYTVVVGAGGPAGPTNSNNGYSKAAGDSSFGDFIVCGGGGGATAVWKGSGIGGAGGTVKTCENPVQLITRTAGNQGKAGGGYTYYAGGVSVLPPHGAGGFGQATGNYAGKSAPGENGYCKIRMLTIEPEQQKINVNFVGNVNFDNGLINNFTTANYLVLPETMPVADEIEFGGKINLEAKSTATKCVYEVSTSSWTGFNIALDGSSRFRLWSGSQNATSTALEINKDYWFKCVCNSAGSTLFLSTDGVEYTQDISITNNQYSSWVGANVYLGVRGYNKTEALTTTAIDLNDCYMKINGEYSWKGIITVKPYTFTINTQLSGGVVTINGENRNTITAMGGDFITWSLTYQGSIIESGRLLLTEDTVLNIDIDRIEFVAWEQPKLTSNTSSGTVSSTNYNSSHPPYIAFDGTKANGTNKYLSQTTGTGDITWQTPEPIRIISCELYTTTESGYLNRFPQTITVYGSDDGVSWDEIGSLSGYEQPASGGFVTVPCNATKTYSYTKWEFTGSTYIGVSEIVITAEKIVKIVDGE